MLLGLLALPSPPTLGLLLLLQLLKDPLTVLIGFLNLDVNPDQKFLRTKHWTHTGTHPGVAAEQVTTKMVVGQSRDRHI